MESSLDDPQDSRWNGHAEDLLRREELESLVISRSQLIECIEKALYSAKKSKVHSIADKLIESSRA
jgi:hypothetical protein